MTKKVINLTPHAVVVVAPEGDIMFPPSGQVARVREIAYDAPSLTTTIGDVPMMRVRYAREVDGLPKQSLDTVHIVSRIVASAVPRRDLVFPQSELRDNSGRIVGCEALGSFQ